MLSLIYLKTTHGLHPPAWNTEEAMNTIVNELMPFQYKVDFGSVEKAKLKGGVMVDQIIRNMEASVNGDLVNSTKMFLYSAVLSCNVFGPFGLKCQSTNNFTIVFSTTTTLSCF